MGLQFVRLLFSASLVKNSPLLTLDNLRTCGLTLLLSETQRIIMRKPCHFDHHHQCHYERYSWWPPPQELGVEKSSHLYPALETRTHKRSQSAITTIGLKARQKQDALAYLRTETHT